MGARVPEFPNASSHFIQELLQAYKLRSKPIKHTFREWKIGLTQDDGEERVDLDFRNHHGHLVRLTAWQAGTMWFRSCKAQLQKSGGWEFIFAFHLNVGSKPASKVVEAFERSRRHDDREAAMEIWREFDPKIDQTFG